MVVWGAWCLHRTVPYWGRNNSIIPYWGRFVLFLTRLLGAAVVSCWCCSYLMSEQNIISFLSFHYFEASKMQNNRKGNDDQHKKNNKKPWYNATPKLSSHQKAENKRKREEKREEEDDMEYEKFVSQCFSIDDFQEEHGGVPASNRVCAQINAQARLRELEQTQGILPLNQENLQAHNQMAEMQEVALSVATAGATTEAAALSEAAALPEVAALAEVAALRQTL